MNQLAQIEHPTPDPHLNLDAFIAQHHRLPRLGDAVQPWHYRGWLLPYIIQLHGLDPSVNNRWDYHLRTLEAGKSRRALELG